MTRIELMRLLGWASLFDFSKSAFRRVLDKTEHQPALRKKALVSLQENGVERLLVVGPMLGCGLVSMTYNLMLPISMDSILTSVICSVAVCRFVRLGNHRHNILSTAVTMEPIRALETVDGPGTGTLLTRPCMMTELAHLGIERAGAEIVSGTEALKT